MTTALDQVASNLVASDDVAPPPELSPGSRRIRIILEENDQIPPTGQYFGVQGRGYVLRAGEEADVPMLIVDILNNAVQDIPVKDQGDRIIGYRSRLRFPYRIINAQRAA